MGEDFPSFAAVTAFNIQDVSLSGSQLVFYGLLDGDQKVFVFDLAVGRVVADVTISTGP